MTPEEIVRALAGLEDIGIADRDYNSGDCGLCGAGDPEYQYHMHEETAHEPTCPWRMAREWVAANPASGDEETE